MMRTLVFCTAYAEHPSVWNDRYRPWLDAVLSGGLGADEILLVDDGSGTLPGWADTHIVSVDVLGDAFCAPLAPGVLLAHFRSRLGRAGVLNFPGWHRSFCFALLYAEKHAFDRVIHIESDAFVISPAATGFLAGFSQGWAAFWSARYDMPESAIQVAAGDGLRRMAAFARQPYEAMIGHAHERTIPFTEVAKEFRGERYGEFIDAIPRDADFAAQVPSARERGFAWFIPGRAPPPPRVQAVRWDLCDGGNGLAALRDGWSAPEARHHWMVGAESTLVLPALRGGGDAVLRLRVTPHVFADVLTSQRLVLVLNGRVLREFYVTLEAVLGCDVPAALLGRQGGDVLRLIHPDAAAPCDLSPRTPDTRRLAVSIEWLELERS